VAIVGGQVKYTPNANYHGTDSYTYTVTSGGKTETATVNVTVTSVDDATVFGGDTNGSGAEDGGAITGTLTAADADGLLHGTVFSIAAAGAPAHGTASIDAATGAWSYTPNADYNGADSFTVRVTDDEGHTATRVISLAVSAVADVSTDTASVAEDGNVTSSVLANDSFEGSPTVTAVTQGAHGTVMIVNAATGQVKYTPAAGYHGSDTYTYTVSSGGVTETATVTVTVSSMDDAPVFGGKTAGSGKEDAGAITGTLTVSDGDGIANPGYTVTGAAARGNASIDAITGAWTYTPAADYNGTDSFTVTVTDDEGHTATQVISLTVTAVADVAADAATVAEDGSVATAVLGNDSFEGTPTVSAVTQGAHGTVTIVDASTGQVKYTPDANYHGSDSYTYTVTSGGVTETATVNVTVTSGDDATLFGGDTAGSGAEDGGAITGTLVVADSDGITTPNYTVAAGAAHGVASIDASTGAWTYTPASDYNGADSFTVTVMDDEGHTASRTIALTVAAAADSVSDRVTATEDTAVTTNVLGNDTFESAGRSVAAVTQGAHGTVTIVDASTGHVRYTPDANFNGSDTYTYTVTSGGVTETATVTVTVRPIDDATVFGGATTASGKEDGGALTGTLAVSDADGMTVPSYTVTGAAAHGSASIDAITGAWTYAPNADYNGTDSFTVTVTDDEGHTATQVISLAVAAVADASSETATVTEDGSVTTAVLGNDSFEGTPTVSAVTQGAHGTVTIVDASTGQVKYTPDANYHGSDSYTYTVTSGGVTETATVNVTVTSGDDATLFGGDTAGSGAEDGGAITGTLVVADSDGITTPNYTVAAGAAHGVASIDASTGAWTYTPAPDYNGADSFTVTVTDDEGNIATQVISLTVAAVADVAPDTATVAEDGSVTTALEDNDSFEGTPALTSVTQGEHGTVTVVDAATGQVKYTPDANYHGSDSYTYTVTSGGVTETATVNVLVTSVDDATSFGGNTAGSGEEDGAALTGTLVLADADGIATPNYTVAGGPAHGAASIDAITGAWTYTPAADYNGADSFTVTVTDDEGHTATQEISVTVAPVADAVDDAAAVAEDGELTTGLLVNDSFEGVPTVLAVTQGAHGTVTIVDASTGQVKYTPDADFHGSDSFTYTVRSGATTETAVVTVAVDAVNDAPQAASGSIATNQDMPASGVLPAASDVDGDVVTYALATPPTHGSVTVDDDGSYSYQPDPGYSGPDSFSYQVDDGLARSTYTVDVSVTPAPPPPPPSVPVVPVPSTGPGAPPPQTAPKPQPAEAPVAPAGGTSDTAGVSSPVLASTPFIMPSLADMNVLTSAPNDYTFVRLGAITTTARLSLLGVAPEILESLDRGFPALRDPAAAARVGAGTGTGAAGGALLSVLNGMPDIVAAGGSLNYTVPRDAFVHSDSRAIIKLEARQVDGRPLPNWIRFDGITGVFNVRPPASGSAPVDVKLVARDNVGREAETTFRIGTPDGARTLLDSTDRGFPLLRVSPAQLSLLRPDGGADVLVPYAPIRDVQQSGRQGLAFTVPADAFAHTNPRAVVRLSASLANGGALPSWLQFDGVTGRVSGTPPAGFSGIVEIRIVARDEQGREAVTRFRLVVQPTGTAPAAGDEHGAADGDRGTELQRADRGVAFGRSAEARETAWGMQGGEPLKRAAPSFAEQLRTVREQPGARDLALQQALSARLVPGKADGHFGGAPLPGV